MKRISVFLILIIVCSSMFFAACGEYTPTTPTRTASMGEIHTEFLTLLYAQFEVPRVSAGSPVDKDLAALRVANQLAAKYGIEPLTMEEVRRHVDAGRSMAQRDPVDLVKSVLPAGDFKWWYRFANRAEVHNAREVYEEHCRLYGAPEPGSMLADIIDVSLSSAEFWVDRRGSQEPKIVKDGPGIQKAWWKKLLRFATIVTTDAIGGTLAGAGGGGVVGAAVVGGLCSYGADSILFGDD